jgi:hypothetical protein
MPNIYDQYDEPGTSGANPYDRFDEPVKRTMAPRQQKGTARSLIEGGAMGVADLGNTLLNAASYLPGKVTDAVRGALPAEHRMRVPDISQMTRTRNADFDAITAENKDSTAFTVGRVGGNIAATLPVGGALGAGTRAAAPMLARGGMSARTVEALSSALASGGFRVGQNAPQSAALTLALRAAGGGATGAASAGLVNPDDALTGGMIGAALPPGLAAVGKVGRTAARSTQAIVKPFTRNGQASMAADLIRRFGEGAPIDVDMSQLVPGSMPTLAEATGNAGIAGLQRTARDLRPNAFVERETLNASAREAAFDGIAGDRAAIESAKAARDNTAEALYGRAFTADSMRQGLARESQQMRAPFSGVGLSGAPEDLATPGLRELIQRPMFKQAAGAAQRLAANNGVELADPLQSLQGLHYIKLALDDALNPAAASAMGRNETSAIMGMRDKLAEELAKVSPTYGAARQTFAEMSQPINAMEALQDLRLTDARGNMTLSKVKNALEGVERARREPGVKAAKSITADQLNMMKAIHADLMRQSSLGLGKSAGSNTFQNIATDNILAQMMPGKLGGLVNGRAGDVLGQIGKLAYSGPNEKIRNTMVDMMLDPSLLPPVAPPRPPTLQEIRAQSVRDLLGSAAYRAAPLAGSSR